MSDPQYERLVLSKNVTMHDLDLDAFADGVLAHRAGKAFHENPDGSAPTARRLSWSLGWNARALRNE